VDLLGAEVFDAVECHQVATLEAELLENLGSVQLAEDVIEEGADVVRVNVVEDDPHLRIAGDALETKDRAEVVIQGASLEGEQRRILEGKQSEASHQGVGQSKVGLPPWVGDSAEPLSCELDECVKVEMATRPRE